MDWLSLLSAFVIGVLATAAVQIVWKRRLAPVFAPEDVVEIHSKVRAFRTRQRVVGQLEKIVGNARTGDVIFAHCRTCRNYSQEFFDSLEEAKRRGVNLMVIITVTEESREFARRLLAIGKDAEKYRSQWEVRGIETEEIRIRIFGYKNETGDKRGEILIALPFVIAYVGLHFKDWRVAEYL